MDSNHTRKITFLKVISVSILLLILLIAGRKNVFAENATLDSGTCGTNATYTITSDGTLTINGTGAITGSWDNYKSFITKVIINDGITEIGRNAFYNFSTLESVSLPGSIKKLNSFSFNYCVQLKTVNLPNGITDIGYCAFGHCYKLDNMTIPDSVKIIDKNAFSHCTSLTSIHIPDRISQIGYSETGNEDGAFAYCTNLSDVTISDSLLETINWDKIFYGTKWKLNKIGGTSGASGTIIWNLSGDGTLTITGSGTLSYAGDFSSEYNLRILTKTADVSGVSKTANSFYNFSNLQTAAFSDTLNTIGTDTFSYCSNLRHVEIPDSVNIIEKRAFRDCTTISNIKIPDSVSTIEGAFENCINISNITIPNSVQTIWYDAFSGWNDNQIITISCRFVSWGWNGNAKFIYRHNQTNISNEKEATCTETGYTGDEVCTTCNEIITKGTMLPSKGHHYVNGICTNCGQDDPEKKSTYALRAITINEQTGWYYADENGNIDKSYTGVTDNEYGWWFVRNGILDFSYTGLGYNDAGWWRIVNGQVDFSCTGPVNSEYGWWFVRNGQIDFAYTGLAQNEFGWWRILNGSVDFSCTGPVNSEYGWWFVRNGQIDFAYTGLAQNEFGWWYINNGMLDFSYSGTVYWYGINYYVKSGQVVF